MNNYLNLPKVNMRALTLLCYTAGAGSIGFFMRWIQRQMAFDENGLVGSSVWNYLLPLYVIISAYLAYNYLRNTAEDGYTVPDRLNTALRSDSRLVSFFYFLFGVMMSAGSILLLANCETDKNAQMLRIVGILGVLSGPCHILLMINAKREKPRWNLCCLYSMVPMLAYCIWLLATYKANDINPVIWGFSIELITVCVCISAFFRIAGFAFAAANGRRSSFLCMATIFMCFMSLADSRYLGMQFMFVATGGMMGLYLWLMTVNLIHTPKVEEEVDLGGFEDLSGVTRKKKRRKL